MQHSPKSKIDCEILQRTLGRDNIRAFIDIDSWFSEVLNLFGLLLRLRFFLNLINF